MDEMCRLYVIFYLEGKFTVFLNENNICFAKVNLYSLNMFYSSHKTTRSRVERGIGQL